MTTPDQLKCTKCHETKPTGEFKPRKQGRKGFSSWCRACCIHMTKQWRAENREERLAKQKTPEYREVANVRQRAWRAANPEKNRELARANKLTQKSKETKRLWRKKRREEDPHFLILDRLRSRMHKVLAQRGLIKTDSSRRLLGCSREALLAHLESQFQPGMTWENRGYGNGKWHIDHIRPCSSFDLRFLPERELCFHYTNLQPLWHEDNLGKGAQWNPE